MLKPTERPPPSFAPRFAASITPGPAAGDDREPASRESPCDVACGLVPAVALAYARRAEDRHGRPVDPVDRLEPGSELVGDRRDVPLEVRVLAPLVEDPTVFHGLELAFDVRRAHGHPEGGCEAEVGDRDGDSLPRRDRVVRASLRSVTGAPPVPKLHRARPEGSGSGSGSARRRSAPRARRGRRARRRGGGRPPRARRRAGRSAAG